MRDPSRGSEIRLDPARRAGTSLLHVLQDLLERTYRLDPCVGDISRFVIGDEGYRLLYGRNVPSRTAGTAGSALRTPPTVPTVPTSDPPRRPSRSQRPGEGAPCGHATPELRWAGTASSGPAAGPRVLVRDDSGTIAVRIYYPDALIAHLEKYPPARGLGDENIDAFAAFVEELDHFLVIAERARLGRPVSLLELELHANVTKYLVCALFLARAAARPAHASLEAERRAWLLWHLFEKVTFAEPEPAVQERYCDASRFGRRFIDRLERERDRGARLALLRAFHDAGGQGKLTLLG